MAHLAAASASPAAAPNRSHEDREEGASHSPLPPMESVRGKVVVVMGATGAGKSRLAVDLAAHFAGVEVVNADSMQVYRGLDVLTNKVPLHEQNGVPHHLLSVIDPSVEFTCRDFRDHALPIIQDILDRGGLPVIVGGTNFYIQALVSPFLIDDTVQDMEECTLSDHLDEMCLANDDEASGYERLKEIDPVAAQRIHPNNKRKIKRYLELYATTGTLPSQLFQGEAAKVFCFSFSSLFDALPHAFISSVKVLDKFTIRALRIVTSTGATASDVSGSPGTSSKELWVQYICKPCNNRILRGVYEWEQHNQGRGHRKEYNG
ncbi:hypothetical protein PR202_gb03616 [Eleusine coracana subsp. coracana]|uniref:Uncharacterized protein n=1 Tax=Eleusine coracana subsp. coracana TaxID=191504 RepID=A0AAV5E1L5_ELECO|nr:hypothetical protein PR202_gb03616 [Eleusine coracana subsp. coracana]